MVMSNKGGVGKSIVSLMLGTSLARQGKKVILVDADLGGSNLHTLAGIRYPLYTLADFINRQVENIEDVVMDTPVENMSSSVPPFDRLRVIRAIDNTLLTFNHPSHSLLSDLLVK